MIKYRLRSFPFLFKQANQTSTDSSRKCSASDLWWQQKMTQMGFNNEVGLKSVSNKLWKVIITWACRLQVCFFHWDNASSKVLFRSLQRDDVCSHELSSKWLWKCCFAKCGCVWTWGLSRKDWYNQQISDNFPFRWNAAATCCRCRGHTAAGHGLPGELDFKTKDTKGPGRRGKSFIKWWLNQENRSLWIYLDMENPWEPEKCGDPFGPWSTFMLGGPYRCDKIGG